MSLNHQWIALRTHVVHGPKKPSRPISPVFVLPFVDAGVSQLHALELWIGVPDDSRFLFIRSNQQRRLIDPLFDADVETPTLRLTLDLSSHLPGTLRRPSVLGSSTN